MDSTYKARATAHAGGSEAFETKYDPALQREYFWHTKLAQAFWTKEEMMAADAA